MWLTDSRRQLGCHLPLGYQEIRPETEKIKSRILEIKRQTEDQLQRAPTPTETATKVAD